MTSCSRSRAALWLLLLGFPAVARAQEPQRTVTLQEAVELALRSSPLMVQRHGAVETAESSERTALGAFLPTLSFSSGASLNSSSRFDPNTSTNLSGSTQSYSASMSTGVDLFTGGRRGANLRLARSNTAAAEAALVEQRFAVTLAAKSAFFEVLRADELIRVSEAQVERARTGLQAAEQRLFVGSATRSDSLRARLEVNQAEQALLQAQNQRRASSYALGATIGLNAPVGARLETPLEPRPIPVTREQIVELALTSAPGVISAQSAVDAADASRGVSRAQYFPTLRASGNTSWNNSEVSLDGGRRSWGTSLSLSYPLFNGFAREDANQRSEVNLRVAHAQLEDQRRQVQANVVRTLDQVLLAEQQLRLAQEAVQVAEEDLRVQSERYRLGASTILDQITSQIALAQAEQNLVTARYDYQIARAQLEALIGREL